MLAAAIAREGLGAGARLLDLCTGSGMLAVAGAVCGLDATAVDVSCKAVWAARLNARANGVAVRALRGSLYRPVAQERFDLIVSNPPYVPSTQTELPSRGLSRAWEAGPDGRVLLDRICIQAPDHLARGGAVLLVHSTLIGEERTHELLAQGGLQTETIERRHGPLGPLMAERVRQGVLPPDTTDEEVVIVRGYRPAR